MDVAVDHPAAPESLRPGAGEHPPTVPPAVRASRQRAALVSLREKQRV